MVKMGNDWNGQMGFQDSSELMLGCPSLELNSGVAEKLVAGLDMNNSSGSMFDSSNGGRMGSCYGSGWSESFGASEMVSHGNFGSPLCPGVSENTGLRGTSQFMHHHYSSDANAVEMLPKLSVSGGSGSFAGMVNPYGLPGCATDKNIVIEKASVDPVQSEEDCRMSKETSLEAKSIGKRKRNAERDVQRDSSVKTSEQKKTDERKLKIEENDSSDQGNKKTTDTSLGGEVSKGDYVHVRARSGQATNSHSLAERVRREKINDRMKLLQELVPGCNKITGKAVMLDEIINYVQSLQQQVEFLSMKLATVNPELNVNNDQSLSKDIFHFRDSSAGAPILGLNPGMSSSHLCATGIHHGAFPGIPSTAAPYHPAPQGMWDGDLQSLLRMGFDSNPPISDLGPNGSSKT